MNSSEELQRLYWSTLTGNGAIMALVAGVYDKVPASPFGTKTAYIVLGETDDTEDDADCITGVEKNTTIHVWSRKDGKIECKQLVDLVRKALHRQSLNMSDNALVDTWVEFTRVFPDPDGATTHGVIQVRAIVEEP